MTKYKIKSPYINKLVSETSWNQISKRSYLEDLVYYEQAVICASKFSGAGLASSLLLNCLGLKSELKSKISSHNYEVINKAISACRIDISKDDSNIILLELSENRSATDTEITKFRADLEASKKHEIEQESLKHQEEYKNWIEQGGLE